MELCDLNLDHYIQRKWPDGIKEKAPYFVNVDGTPTKLVQIWKIISDISSGLTFIHTKKEIHRDLKPQNGSST
jgi:serine/threonine protein kinase